MYICPSSHHELFWHTCCTVVLWIFCSEINLATNLFFADRLCARGLEWSSDGGSHPRAGANVACLYFRHCCSHHLCLSCPHSERGSERSLRWDSCPLHWKTADPVIQCSLWVSTIHASTIQQPVPVAILSTFLISNVTNTDTSNDLWGSLRIIVCEHHEGLLSLYICALTPNVSVRYCSLPWILLCWQVSWHQKLS